MSEYEGELYYLGIQTDISADFHPPYLGHKVLVEGAVSNEPRICGGIVLKPVRVSPLPELDGACNTILPAVDQYTVPFAPRPPGPSGGRLAFQAATPPPAPPIVTPASGPKEFALQYDFDMPVMGRHAAVLSQIVEYARDLGARRLRVTAYRGSTMLSDGRVMTEAAGIAEARGKEVVELLRGAGLTQVAIDMTAQREPERATGVDDWRSRRTTVLVEPGGGTVLRPNAIVHSVADLDRSLAFYRGVLGLELDTVAAVPGGSSPEVRRLVNAPGASIRTATLRIPGTDLRLVLAQFSGVDRRAVTPRIQDPGVVKTAFRVRDMDAAFAKIEKHLSSVLTEGGSPIRPEGPAGFNRSVIAKDPDGFVVEFALQNVPPLPDNLSPTSTIIGGWASLIVDSLATSIEFYRDKLGFTFSSNGRPVSPLVLSLQGLPAATGTISAASKPAGSAYNWFVYEFKGVNRAAPQTRLQDPGTASVSFLVDDVRALLQHLKASGVRVETAGGEPVVIGGTTRVVVRDPSGILIELVEAKR
jgi:catechol 2,3-dioxygenase-like lactoylglutathione lyase family enzyme